MSRDTNQPYSKANKEGYRLSYLDREPRPWSWATTLVLLTVCSAAFGLVMGLFIGAVILGGF